MFSIKSSTPLEKLFYVTAFACVIILLFVGIPFIYQMSTMRSEQEVAKDITISSDWQEITPEKPLRPNKQFQSLVLDVVESLVKDNNNLKLIRFTNQVVISPEVQMIDQDGNVFDIDLSRAPTPSIYENSISGSAPYLPNKRIYTKVRLRCDKPLKLSRIIWHCWNGK